MPSSSAEGFIQRVRAVPRPGRLVSLTAPRLAVMRHLNRQLACSDATIEHLAAQDPRGPRLRSVPRSGPVTAAAFPTAIDDAQRFPHAHQLEAYLGLVPRAYSSGETPRRGPITKAGHPRVPWLLIQAALSILRRRPPAAEVLWTWAQAEPARDRERVGRRVEQVGAVAFRKRVAATNRGAPLRFEPCLRHEVKARLDRAGVRLVRLQHLGELTDDPRRERRLVGFALQPAALVAGKGRFAALLELEAAGWDWRSSG